MGTYIVKYDYIAKASDELTVQKGDMIIDGLSLGYGWIQGECRGKIGHVPAGIVMELRKDRSKPPRLLQRQSIGQEMKSDRSKNRLSDPTTQIPPYRAFYPVKVLYEYKPAHPDELALKPNDIIYVIRLVEKGWYEGMLDGKRGLFPSNYVSWSYDEQKENQIPVPKRSVQCHARALYNYHPTADDELSLTAGDIVNVLDKHMEDEGWWKGEVNGRMGIFPKTYVEELPSPSLPTRRQPTMNMDSSTNYWTKSFIYKSNDEEVSEAGHLPAISKPSKGTNGTPISQHTTNDQWQSELSNIRQSIDGMKYNLVEQIADLARELDSEKKARAALQVELERIQKLLQKVSQRMN